MGPGLRISLRFIPFDNEDDFRQLDDEALETEKMAALLNRSLKPPSPEDWDQLKHLIIRKQEEGWKNKEISAMLKDRNYNITPKMVGNRLRRWGKRTYQKSPEKEAFLLQAHENLLHDRPMPQITATQRQKLVRWLKSNVGRLEGENMLLEWLQSAETVETSTISTTCDFDSDEGEDDNEQGEDYVWLPNEDDTGNNQSLSSGAGSSQWSGHGNEVPMTAGPSRQMTHRMSTTSSHHESTYVTYNTIVRQPSHLNQAGRELEKLFYLSRRWHMLRLQEHIQNLPSSNGGTYDIQSEPNVLKYENAVAMNRKFWTKIKSGIYYLKIGNEALATSELTERQADIAFLCKEQPFTLLRDMVSTISPVAMQMTSGLQRLRLELLQLFRHNTGMNAHDNLFSEICSLLCNTEAVDELSQKMLRVMLDGTMGHLQPDSEVIFELHRTIVRLYRRTKDFQQAESEADKLITNCEKLFGRNHVRTRLAITEKVYILNDQGWFNEALEAAREVNFRGQADLGSSFPDERSIYAMEDIAEICENLGDLQGAINWLQTAFRAALTMWGNRSSTIHIWEKLEATHEKRYQLACELARLSAA